jgi:glycogen debranching enzyme
LKRLKAATIAALFLFMHATQAPSPRAAVRGQTEGIRLTPKFAPPASGLELERRAQAGSFFGVLGRRSAALGYEHRALEVWAYPLQILDRFELSFRLEGYPLEFEGADTLSLVNVRPEATTFVYTHAAFTVRQHVFAPVEEPGVVMLFDVDSALPLSINVSFRPRLRLMWPAGSMTAGAGWDERERAFFVTEETGRHAGVIGSPAARDANEMPYQEEPRDVPLSFTLKASPEQLGGSFIPVVIAGSVRGRSDAAAVYKRLLSDARALYEKNVRHYRRLLEETTSVTTPDGRLNEALSWAKVGIDKGVVDNPLLGTGLVAGFRTAGESERPGFAWFFGRDSLWTSFALNSYGDFETTRAALDFLKKFQRADGKIPHEISQSASLVPWFTQYEYPWASADATPLYVAAHADLWRASGDTAYTRANWDAILKAYSFTAGTDTDRNGLVENTKFGHGWVEGGALYPPHEEIYQQGVWVEACRGLAEMAEALGEKSAAAEARAAAERTRAAIEKTFWLPERGFYAFATNLPRTGPRKAEPGPNRAVRQERMDELDKSRLVDEETVTPAVALWWRALEDGRAQGQIDSLGSARIATDWGARMISDESRLYDPLSYHHGSVWPLFTGWASLGAYNYGRPHVGLQALMANVLLHRQNALGYVTELLSGDFNAPFGRSSHHQVWSEAMVVAPLVRGLLGLEASDGGRALRFAPQLPADWGGVRIRGFAAGRAKLNLRMSRYHNSLGLLIERRESGAGAPAGGETTVRFAPSFPLDAKIQSVRVNGRPVKFDLKTIGDMQVAEVEVAVRREVNVSVDLIEGTSVYTDYEAPAPGARSRGLRILRSRAGADSLTLLLEGVAGRSYEVGFKSPKQAGAAEGVEPLPAPVGGGDRRLRIRFDGPPGRYVRREARIPLGRV